MRPSILVAAVLAAALTPPQAHATAAESLARCQRVVAAQSAKYLRATADTVGQCLGAISTAVIKGGRTTAEATTASTSTCLTALAKIRNSQTPSHTFGAKFEAKVAARCDPAVNPGLDHGEPATWTIGDATLGAANLSEYCAAFGGDGTLDSFAEWRSCVRAAADTQAREAIAVRWPRALEYFEALEPALAALPPSTAVSDAITALGEIDDGIEGSVENNLPDPRSRSTGLLATGANVCFLGLGGDAPCPAGTTQQDANTQAGFVAQYRDNGDGTITDLITGLTWEKLGSDGTIHDHLAVYSIEDAVAVKIAALNAGNGFAGHSDWRLPNRRELESLTDFGFENAPIHPQFSEGCASSCSATDCSCTAPAPYWTSTSYQGDATQRWVVDFLNGLVRRSSAATAHVRAVRGGVTAGAVAAPATSSDPPATLNACQHAVARASGKYIRRLGAAAGKCLTAMTAGVIKRGATTEQAAQRSAAACVAAFARLENSAEPNADFGGAFLAAVAAKCDPAINRALRHLDVDTYAVGSRTLSAAQLGPYCAELGGDGNIDSFAKWANCLRRAAEGEADEAIALRWPRSLEYFAALRTQLATLPASARTTDALAALTALDARIEGEIDDDKPDLPPDPPAGLLVTGQTQCVQGDSSMGACPGVLPRQDGDVRAGIARSFTDNGDGTITDDVTGLMWEKLSDDDSIHDRDHDYNGVGALLNKIARLNRHSFAGYNDWRLPNSREYESLVDAGRTAPAIDPAFDSACTPGCTNLECSCTASDRYMSSTWKAQPPKGYVAFDFTDGSSHLYAGSKVRAVRAGNQPPHPAPDGPPVAWDLNVRFPWREECNSITMMGTDESDMTFARIKEFPSHGIITNYIVNSLHENPAADSLTTERMVSPIPAAQPDVFFYWGPTDNSFLAESLMQMFPAPIPVGFIPPTPLKAQGRLIVTRCYVPFSPTFVGTDSFTFEIVDQEGNVSNAATATITVYEVP